MDHPANYFECFALPVTYEIDPAVLQSRYLEACRATHPDLAGTDEDSQIDALERSAQINEAFRILSDPRERAEYLLRLQGVAPAEADRSLPPGLLEQMLTVREQLAEAQLAGHAETVTSLLTRIRRQEMELLRAISHEFRDGSAGAAQRIRVHLNALRFVQRIIEQYPAP